MVFYKLTTLSNYKRRQKDKLSSEKISKVLRGYNKLIDDNKKVIISLNEDLKL